MCLALYDTYSISGLPAGAITNPGIDAIAAALNPDQEYLDEGYYFFVTGNRTATTLANILCQNGRRTPSELHHRRLGLIKAELH